MDWTLLVTQILNGLQLGVLLFLLAAGLTLIFGILDFINLAHGSLYMVGAYFCASFSDWTGSFVLGVLIALPLTFLVGIAVEIVVARPLYTRDHLDHVLATFGAILFFDSLVQLTWPIATIGYRAAVARSSMRSTGTLTSKVTATPCAYISMRSFAARHSSRFLSSWSPSSPRN